MTKIKVAVGYARSSGQINPKSSIPNQISMIENYCKEQGIFLKTIFKDDCKTGTKVEGRSEYINMKESIKADPNIDMVIVAFSDRLARDAYELIVTMDEIIKLGIEFISIGEGVSSRWLSPIHTVMLGIQAETENKQRQLRIRSSMSERTKKGIYIRKKTPLGYKKNEAGKLIINTEEVSLVEEIFSSFLDGKGIQEIATQLKSNKIIDDLKIGNLYQYVWGILTNKIYTGYIYRKIVDKNQLTYERVSNVKHPQIVSEEHFKLVHQKLQSNKKNYQNRKFYLCSGIVVCPKCNYKLSGRKDNKYICSKCNYNISKILLEEKFFKFLKCHEDHSSELISRVNEYENINRNIIELQQKYATASISEENYKKKLTILQDKFNSLITNANTNVIVAKKSSLLYYLENNMFENLKKELKSRNEFYTIGSDSNILKLKRV